MVQKGRKRQMSKKTSQSRQKKEAYKKRMLLALGLILFATLVVAGTVVITNSNGDGITGAVVALDDTDSGELLLDSSSSESSGNDPSDSAGFNDWEVSSEEESVTYPSSASNYQPEEEETPAGGSDEDAEIIVATQAMHLDSNREFISDIFPDIVNLDGNWSETIPANDYVRVRFEENLTNESDITIYPWVVSGNPTIIVYEKNGTQAITQFTTLSNNSYNKVLLSNWNGYQDTFDLLVIGGEVRFDHILDPNSAPVIDYLALSTTNITLNSTNENLTITLATTDLDNDSLKNITNWIVNGDSILALNIPFERINGTSVGNAYDYSGHGRYASKIVASWNSSGGSDARGAYMFDGVTDTINTPAFNYGSTFSISLWVKPNEISRNQILTSKYSPGSPGGVETKIEGDQVHFMIYDTNGVGIGRYGDLPADTWTHLVFTYDGGTDHNALKIYGDGTRIDAGNDSLGVSFVSFIDNVENTSLGSAPNLTNSLNGSLDDLLIFRNRTLSQGQAKAIYLNETPPMVSDETSTADTWQVCMTSNDGTVDSQEVCSNTITILQDTTTCQRTYDTNVDYPEWTVGNLVSCSSEQLDVGGTVTINSSGTLWLSGAKLIFGLTSNGSSRLNVQSGGNFTALSNSRISVNDSLFRSRISTASPKFRIANSNVNGIGYSDGTGAFVEGEGLYIKENVNCNNKIKITDSTFTNGSTAIIMDGDNCKIVKSTFYQDGIGIALSAKSSGTTLNQNTFYDSRITSSAPRSIFLMGGSQTITSNVFNLTQANSAGVSITKKSTTGNIIQSNTFEGGDSGIFTDNSMNHGNSYGVEIKQNIFRHQTNISLSLRQSAGDFTVARNIFWNTSTAIRLNNLTGTLILNGNRVRDSSLGIFSNTSLSSSTIWNNRYINSTSILKLEGTTDEIITNFTAGTSYGNVTFFSLNTSGVSGTITDSDINVSTGPLGSQVQVSSSSFSFLNTSARVTLTNPTNNVPLLDADGDGIFTLCQTCTVIDYSAGNYLIFDVTHFSTYATGNATAPSVTITSPTMDQTFDMSESIPIAADVTSDVTVGTVIAQITDPNSGKTNYTLSYTAGDSYNYTYVHSNIAGGYTVQIFANNSDNTWNTTETTTFIISQAAPPAVTNLVPTNGSEVEANVSLLVQASVSGTLTVDDVIAMVTYPNTTNRNFSMSPVAGIHSVDFMPEALGLYTIVFFANDTSNNVNNSEQIQFTAVAAASNDVGTSITGASISNRTDLGSFTETTAGSDNASGSVITSLSLNTTSSTLKWQGYSGTVSGSLALGSGSDSLYSFGNIPTTQVLSVFASPSSGFNFATLQTVDTQISNGSVDQLFGFTVSDMDSINSTFDGNMRSTISDVTLVRTTGLNSYDSSSRILSQTTYQSGILTDSSAPTTLNNFVFGVSVVASQYDFKNNSQVDFQVMVPVDNAITGQDYYFFMDLQ